jgi:hypothetical protein
MRFDFVQKCASSSYEGNTLLGDICQRWGIRGYNAALPTDVDWLTFVAHNYRKKWSTPCE